jgi:threonine dehydratase
MPYYTNAPALTSTYIDEVWEALPSHIRPTFFLHDATLSALFNCDVTIASETFQYTGSFKFRAAYNLLSSVPHRHIIAASSGNFGQAVAYACELLEKQCTIVMPTTSAQVKIAAVRSYDGIVDLIDVRQVSRAARVAALLKQDSEAFQANAYDDYRVVTGNSTLGREILNFAAFDTIVVPVGGGGLSSGVVIARDHLQAGTEIVGAEPVPGDDAARSLRRGTLVSNEQEPPTVADGARTLSLGKLNWEILQQGLADIIPVPDWRTLQALRHHFLYNNLKVEPTGALTIGALLTQPERFRGKRICCIASGGNADPALYAQVLMQKEEPGPIATLDR